MAFNMGSLVFRMAADVAGLTKSMDEAKTSVNKGVQGITSSINAAKTVLGTLGVGFSVGGILAGLKSIADEIDDLADAAAGLNIAAVALAEMRVAFAEVGVESNRLELGLNKLNQAIAGAADGNKEQVALFKQLGVAYKDARGNARNVEDVLRDMADAFSQHADGANKSAIANDLLGKAAYKWIPVLNQGSDALRRNAGLTEETVKEAQKLGAEMDTLAASWKTATNALAGGLIPEVNALIRSLKELFGLSKDNKGFWEGLWEGIKEGDPFKNSAGRKRLRRDGISPEQEADVRAQIAEIDRLLASADPAERFAGKMRRDKNLPILQRTLREGGRDIPGTNAFEAEFSASGANPVSGKTKDFGNRPDTGTPKPLEALSQNLEDAKQYESIYTKLLGTQQQHKELSEEQVLLLRMQNGELSTLSETAKDILLSKAREVDYENKQRQLKKEGEGSLKLEIQQLETIKESIKTQEAENKVLGLTEEQQRQYNIEIQKTILAKLKLKQITPELSEAELSAITAQVEAQEKLIKSMEEGAGKKASIESAKAAKEAWDEAARDIAQSLTDAMVQGFESGKGVARSVGDWIKNYFKTSVARSLADSMTAMLRNMMGSLASSVAGIVGGGASGGVGNFAGSFFNIGTSATSNGAAQGMGGGFFNSAISSIASASPLMSGVMAGLFNGAGFGGTMTAAGSLIGTGTAAGGMAGIGMGIGAAAPYVAAAYGLYRLISGVGTGRDRSPAYQEFSAMSGGGDALANFFGGSVKNPAGGSWAGGHYDAQVLGMINAVSSVAKSFGGSINKGTQFGQFTSTSPDGKGAQVVGEVRGAGGASLYNSNVNVGNADRNSHMALLAPNMILAGLKDSNLPTKIKEYFNSFTGNVTQESLDVLLKTASAAHSMSEAFKSLGGPFAQLQDLSVEAREALAGFTGGIEAFLQKVQGYYSAFYSQEEQQAMSLLSARRELEAAGIDTSSFGGDTREDALKSFRDAVEGLNVNTEEGRKQFAAFMNASGAYASGADLLAATGLDLNELTAGAPNYDEVINATVQSTADQTTVLARAIEDSASRMVAALQAQQISVNVAVNQPASVEVYGGGA